MIVIVYRAIIPLNCKSTIADNPENPQSLNASACVQGKIDLIKNVPEWNPPASIYSYVCKNQAVYSFSADCYDQYNVVYDAIGK